MSHSIPIPNISDADKGHETNDDYVRRTRSRFRRIHNKLGNRHRRRSNRFFRQAVRKLRQWSMIPILLLSMGLIVYEVSEIWKKLEEPPGSKQETAPVTHIVQGVRERCLKLLPLEAIQTLSFPLEKSVSPFQEIVYITGDNSSFPNEKTTLPKQPFYPLRFNMFTGFQTLSERNDSFKVNGRVTVHCGFYSDNGGFKVSDEDMSYMETCQIVVSTSAFGGGDDLYQPIGMYKETLKRVCYVAFLDEITLTTQELEGFTIDNNRMIGKWRVIIVKELPFVDQQLNSQIPKMLGHRLFPKAKYSIWVDSKSQFQRDLMAVLEALLWRTKSILAISEHSVHISIYDESSLDMQMTQYRTDGFPEFNKSNAQQKALNEDSVIIREHTPLTNMLMCLWFNEVIRFSSCGHISFHYVMWRMEVLKDINMFPLCAHMELVNTFGQS